MSGPGGTNTRVIPKVITVNLRQHAARSSQQESLALPNDDAKALWHYAQRAIEIHAALSEMSGI